MALKNRLAKNHKHLRKWAKRQGIEAWRLYDRDIPEYPYIIDIYADKAIVWLRLEEIDKTPERKNHLTELYEGLEELGYSEDKRIIKERRKQDRHDRYQKEDAKKQTKIIKEKDLSFEVNLTDYLDTGLFLDHRPWREKILTMDLKGKKALNLFCYTGSLSVALAHAGAEVTSIDLSPHYLDWAKRNFTHNDLNPRDHQWHCGDCIKAIREMVDDYKDNRSLGFDFIVIDPPSFSVSKKFKGTFDVERDHEFLVDACLKLLRPQGKLWFSTNLRSFKLNPKYQDFKDTSFQTIPQDFHDKKIHKTFEYQS